MSSNVHYEMTALGTDGFCFYPEIKAYGVFSNHAVVEAHQVWDLKKFQTVRQPVVVGATDLRMTESGIRVLDLPIKFPGSNEYRLPQELASFLPAIQKIINFDHNVCVNECGSSKEYFAYLTVDQGFIQKDTTQRIGGCHVDGFQGSRIVPKTKVNRSYSVTDVQPTEYFVQAFETSHLDDTKHNFFLDFDYQAKPEAIWKPNTNDIVLFDAYMVHRAVPMAANGNRVFLRLSYDTKEFDRKGNTHNPMFDYSWNMVERDIQQTLVKYR